MAATRFVSLAVGLAILWVALPTKSKPPLYAFAPGVCVDASNPDLVRYRDGYADMVSDADTAAARNRTNLSLPTLDSTQVLIVADSAACQAASLAYDIALGISKPTIPVMVLQLATKRIVIKDIGWEGPALNVLFNQDYTQVLERIWY